MLLEAADEWLRTRAMEAVRSGFAAFLDYPYAIDNYGAFPSFLLRANPAYYHRYLKNAGFETERGQIDYTARLTPEIIARYHGMLDAANRGGIQLRSWREFGFLAAVDAWTGVTNIAFRKHWGWNPVTNAEVRPMLTSLWETPVADLSMIAMSDRRVVGAVFAFPISARRWRRSSAGVKLPPDHGGGTRGALINIGVIDEAQGRRRRARDGGAIIYRDAAPGDAIRRLHAGARRQLGLAPNRREPGRAGDWEFSDLPAQLPHGDRMTRVLPSESRARSSLIMLFSWRMLVLFVHVTSVIVALGGSLFSTFALTPVLAQELDVAIASKWRAASFGGSAASC